MPTDENREYNRYMCLICGYIYDEAAGAPDEGIAPGTRWEDVPDDWYCPTCGAEKADFEIALKLREEFRDNLGKRTKRLAKQTLFEKFVAVGNTEDDAEKVAEVLLAGISVWLADETKTEYLLYFGNEEIRKLTKVGVDNFAELLATYDEMQKIKAESIEKKKKKSRIKSAIEKVIGKKSDVEKTIGKKLEDILDGGKAADIALFGRMLADLPERNIEAASQVANAISTHKTSVEFDFYTAVDDLKPDDIAGADMLGVIEFNSACYYRYANVNIEKLEENLAGGKAVLDKLKEKVGDEEAKETLAALKNFAKITVEAFLRAAVEAIPTGKQNWSATHEKPDFILAVLQDTAKCSMANAFVKPIKETEDKDLIAASVEAFEKRWEKVAMGYGDDSFKKSFNISNYDLTLQSFKDAQEKSIEELIKKTVAQIFDKEA